MTLHVPSLLHSAIILAGMSGCPNAGFEPGVHVQLDPSDPPYDTTMTMDDLTSNFANNPDSTLSTEGGWHLAGLTLSNVRMHYSAQFMIQPISETEVCISVHDVNVDMVYTPTIYIAADFLDKKCQYDLTVAHEQRHVGTDLEVFNDFTIPLEKKMSSYLYTLGPQGPFDHNDIEQAQDQILQQIVADSEPLNDELAQVRRQRQAVFDTEQNYLAEQSLCAGQE